MACMFDEVLTVAYRYPSIGQAMTVQALLQCWVLLDSKLVARAAQGTGGQPLLATGIT